MSYKNIIIKTKTLKKKKLKFNFWNENFYLVFFRTIVTDDGISVFVSR